MLRKKFTNKEWRVSRQHKFCGNTTHLLFSVKIRLHELLQIPSSWATLRTVTRRFWRITASTFSTWSSSIYVEVRPNLGSSSMDVQPDFKRWYHLWHCVRLKTILSISLFQHLKSLRKCFSLFETKFDAKALLLNIYHLSTCKKSPRVLTTRSFKHV